MTKEIWEIVLLPFLGTIMFTFGFTLMMALDVALG